MTTEDMVCLINNLHHLERDQTFSAVTPSFLQVVKKGLNKPSKKCESKFKQEVIEVKTKLQASREKIGGALSHFASTLIGTRYGNLRIISLLSSTAHPSKFSRAKGRSSLESLICGSL